VSKSSVLRETLAAGPLNLDDLIAAAETNSGYIFNRKKTVDLLSAMKAKGCIAYDGEGDDRRYLLAPAAPKKTTKALPAKSQPAARTPQTYEGLARKYSDVETKLLQHHVGTTLMVLEALLDFDESDPSVRAAFKAHKEAVGMAMGAG
jgi:hypothetical protein